MSVPKKWSRRGEFVNMVLAWGAARAYAEIDEDINFDGVAGERFDFFTDPHLADKDDANQLIAMAIKLGVPVKGLKANGTLGEKWAEVVALCKAA